MPLATALVVYGNHEAGLDSCLVRYYEFLTPTPFNSLAGKVSFYYPQRGSISQHFAALVAARWFGCYVTSAR